MMIKNLKLLSAFPLILLIVSACCNCDEQTKTPEKATQEVADTTAKVAEQEHNYKIEYPLGSADTLECGKLNYIFKNGNDESQVTFSFIAGCKEGTSSVVIFDADGDVVDQVNILQGAEDEKVFTVPPGGKIMYLCLGKDGEGCSFKVVEGPIPD